MSDKKSSLFEKLGAKVSFILGLIGALLVACTVGFFILLANAMDDNSESVKKTANLNVNNNDNIKAPLANSGNANGRVNIELTQQDRIRGEADAPVIIVEYSDFQCPYCSRFHPTLQQLFDEYDGQVAWIYRHFPLDSIHPQARPAAVASECVADLAGNDAFWEFTDSLFQNQSSLGQALYEQLAQSVGADLNDFKDCQSSGKFDAKVQADFQSGAGLGVNGTPGSFINGVPVKGALPYDSIKQIIESELN